MHERINDFFRPIHSSATYYSLVYNVPETYLVDQV